MIGLEERARKKKRVGKGAVYKTKPQSRPQHRVGKCTRWDPKITRKENSRIRVRKHDRSAYGVKIMYFPHALSSAKKHVSAVIAVRGYAAGPGRHALPPSYCGRGPGPGPWHLSRPWSTRPFSFSLQARLHAASSDYPILYGDIFNMVEALQ
jgi:hypothetical protein